MITENEILEGNKMIAAFMGWYYSTSFEGLLPNHWVKENGETATDYLHTELIFHSSWDWLMPVVEEIEKLYDEFHGYFGVHISSNSCTIQGTKLRTDKEHFHPAYFAEHYGKTKIEAVWLAVVEFIKWLNKNKLKC